MAQPPATLSPCLGLDLMLPGRAVDVGQVTYVFLRFIEKWVEEGRFPREELRARWWIAGLGGLVLAALAIALLVAAN